MKRVCRLSFQNGSKEEILPDFSDDFPYLASRAEIHRYPGRSVPANCVAAGNPCRVLRFF